MIKTVSVDTSRTPAGNLELAGRMMGHVVQAQPRWSPGSLSNSILGESSDPLILVITSRSVLALNNSAGVSVQGVIEGNVIMNFPGNPLDLEVFSAVSGDSKSKFIDVPGVSLGSLDLVYDNPILGDGHAVYELLRPKRPSFTLLSLVNSLESILASEGSSYFFIVDQFAETVSIGIANNDSRIDSALGTYFEEGEYTFHDLPVVAAFHTIADPASSSTPSYGWE